jgi:DNA-binding transcriptional LysR family regulator
LNCDAGGLLRKVQLLGAQHGVVQKINRKWVLTQEGHALLGWMQEGIVQQRAILESKLTVRIASTVWFTEQVLSPAIGQLVKLIPNIQNIDFIDPENEYEESLLNADFDFAIVCHPPDDPSISHSQIREEPWSVIVSKMLLEKYNRSAQIGLYDLQEIPFIRHRNLNPESILPIDFAVKVSGFSFNNLIGVRSAVINNYGWSIVPTALVLTEVENKKICTLDHKFKMGRKICVWWARGSKEGKRHNSMICRWVKEACANF